MAEVLSQNEIDSLLKQLSSGGVDMEEVPVEKKERIREYNFARPSKFSKEHLRTLEIIFEHYVRLLSTHLPAYFRKTVTIEVVSSEAVSYSEFSSSLSNPVLFGMVNFAPLKGSIVIELASNLGFTIVDLMLGGTGDPIEANRDFSEIELSIIERIYNVFVNLLVEPWGNVVDLEPRLERIETNLQFVQFIAPTEMVAIVTINIKIGEVEGLTNVVLPFICLESVMDKLNTKYWFSVMQDKEDESYQDTIETVISRANVPIKAVLGRSSISVSDFANLQAGDVIRLDSKTEDELQIYVGNMQKFRGLPGASAEYYAVKVTSVMREES